MRDSLHGAFGSRRSMKMVLWLDTLVAAVVFACGMGFFVTATFDNNNAKLFFYPCCLAAAVVAAGTFLVARFRGPAEIRDTIWACLQLDPNDMPRAAAE
jgi:hypothetical protein